MAFIDPKEEILKIRLTDYGRKKLSEGKLKIKYFAFADDEVDYLNRDFFLSSSVEVVLSASLVNDDGDILVNDDGEIIYNII